MLIGFALLVVGGIAAYPSLRDAIGPDAPQGFGDEAALGVSIVQSAETLPRISRDTQPPTDVVESAPLVLPETPLQPQAADSAEPTTAPVDPTPAVEAAPPADDAPSPNASFEPGPPERLVIPAIELDAPVDLVSWSVTVQNGQQVSMWDVPNRFAAGWLKTTARIGEPGNTVLDGHHNIAGEVFRDLSQLKAGDSVQVWAGGKSRDYVVTLMKILPEKGQPIEVRVDNAKWIQPTNDERVTLVTCWPYTNNTHRLIVVALPIDKALPDRLKEVE